MLAVIAALAVSGAHAEPCRLALALALDVSGSVDGREYRLQADGLADALADPEVRDLLLALPDAPVALAVYEWSASRYQRLVLDWVYIADEAALAGVVARLRAVAREDAPEPTGLGAALRFGKRLLDAGPACWNQTLDVSGDGKNNDWPTPRQLRAERALAGLRINALVVVENRDETRAGGGEMGELPAYFNTEVIQGPGAFVEVARGFEDYARAMKRKLLKEIAAQPLGAVQQKHPEFPDRF